uniref:FAR1 domain-containing protein n=1 Tax=Lactuca sativa TaxID=4236 RepID=A0A9R1VUF8_LACSA|nr:hypothetical protein LSAT_V11C400183540 [Lactuca sativa]
MYGTFITLKDMHYLFEIQLQCDRRVPIEIDCVLAIKKKRNTGSRLIKCTFQIVGKKGIDGSWAINAKNLTHNHEPYTDMSGHPSFFQLSSDDVQSIKKHVSFWCTPKANYFFFAEKNQNLPTNS